MEIRITLYCYLYNLVFWNVCQPMAGALELMIFNFLPTQTMLGFCDIVETRVILNSCYSIFFSG